ncbi:MAG: hypothetical protein M1837_001248 [Sclerophora amabilis]|nr:MAG: hypothetical protein M1837_001248 [Sclerophora amabilis]
MDPENFDWADQFVDYDYPADLYDPLQSVTEERARRSSESCPTMLAPACTSVIAPLSRVGVSGSSTSPCINSESVETDFAWTQNPFPGNVNGQGTGNEGHECGEHGTASSFWKVSTVTVPNLQAQLSIANELSLSDEMSQNCEMMTKTPRMSGPTSRILKAEQVLQSEGAFYRPLPGPQCAFEPLAIQSSFQDGILPWSSYHRRYPENTRPEAVILDPQLGNPYEIEAKTSDLQYQSRGLDGDAALLDDTSFQQDETPFVSPLGPLRSNAGHLSVGDSSCITSAKDDSPKKDEVANSALVSSSRKKNGRKRYLSKEANQKAQALRKAKASCVRCAVAKAKCDFEDTVCKRCMYTPIRTRALPCDRRYIPDLISDLKPGIFFRHLKPENLEIYCGQHLAEWCGNVIYTETTWGFGTPTQHKVVEFVPRDSELDTQSQYLRDSAGLWSREVKVSPRVAMTRMPSNREVGLDNQYLEEILNEHLGDFPAFFYCHPDQASSEHLLRSICRLFKAGPVDELFKLAFKVQISTSIASSSFTVVEGRKKQLFEQLERHPGVDEFPEHTTPRLLNRQLKCLLDKLLDDVLTKFLKKLHQRIRDDKTSWTTMFCSLVLLIMAFEKLQVTIQFVVERSLESGDSNFDYSDLANACMRMQGAVRYLTTKFHGKYCSGKKTAFNPIRDGVTARAPKDLDGPSLSFVDRLTELLLESEN